jgi:hypothetical protein
MLIFSKLALMVYFTDNIVLNLNILIFINIVYGYFLFTPAID